MEIITAKQLMEYIGDMILQNVPKVRATHCVPLELSMWGSVARSNECFGSIGMGNFLDHWIFGSCPSSSILETREHNVLETGSVSVLGGGEDTCSVRSLRKSEPQSLENFLFIRRTVSYWRKPQCHGNSEFVEVLCLVCQKQLVLWK
jgi:hypothetical protein